jgi:general nucleoside transport system permease protein
MNTVLGWLERFRLAAACAAALLVGAALIALTGVSPLQAYRELVAGAFFDYWGLAATLTKTCPILLAGLAVIIPMRAGLFNIGAEGQIYIGALTATLAALGLPPGLPPLMAIVLTSLAGAAGGALWAAIPGWLRAYRDTNEVIVTLLMNFIAIHIVSYTVSGPLMAEGAPYPYSAEVPDTARLPILMPQTDAHVGVAIALAIAAAVFVVIRWSSFGMALDIVGKNRQAALYAGLPVRRHLLVSMALGGAVAGLAGAYEVLGMKYRLYHLFSPGYGFDGVVVAFMAGGSAALAPLAAFLISGLKAGSNAMQRAVGIEGTVVDAIQGLIVVFAAASQHARIRDWFKGRPNRPTSASAARGDTPREAANV